MIRDLRPVAVPGWRVAVATGSAARGAEPASATVEVLTLIGWALVADPDNGDWWGPAWWDDLGVTTGNPWQQIAWPLGPGDDLDDELRDHLHAEAIETARPRRGDA